MKRYIYPLLISAAFVLMAAGCSTPDGSREDYFGYNNHPKQREPEPVHYAGTINTNRDDEDNFTNPLAGEYDGNVLVVHDYPSRRFVNVIVPWWAPYWNYYPYYTNIYYDPWYYNWYWYSPWYDFHPYYGITWNDYYNHHHHWYNSWNDTWHRRSYRSYYYGDDYNRYDKPKDKTYRRFGPSRDGITTVGNNSGSNGNNRDAGDRGAGRRTTNGGYAQPDGSASGSANTGREGQPSGTNERRGGSYRDDNPSRGTTSGSSSSSSSRPSSGSGGASYRPPDSAPSSSPSSSGSSSGGSSNSNSGSSSGSSSGSNGDRGSTRRSR